MTHLFALASRLARRGLMAPLLALAAAITIAGPVAAAPTPVFPPAWPLDSALGYRWASGAVPPTAMRTALVAGATDATATRRSHAPTYTYDPSSSSGVAYGVESVCTVAWIACMRRDVPYAFSVWFREDGHKYDWGTLHWCEVSGVANGCFSAETVMLDELGHVDGLDHHVNLADESDYTDSVVQTISRARPQAGWSADSFGRCDVATLQQTYDVGSWTTPYSTCLDVPTTAALSASPASAGLTGPVTFTATLKSAGSGRLLGNPIASRVVVLQQRIGLTWVDVAAMPVSATAGSYVLTLWSRVATDFRAVFRAPATEGLRGSTSAVVSLGGACTVAPCPLGPVTGTGAR